MAIAVVPDIALREPRLLIPGQPPMGPVVLRAEILQKVQYLVPVFGGNRPTYTLGTRDAVGIGWGTNQFSPAENGLYAGNASDYAYFDSAVNGRSINYCAWGFVALCLDPGTNNRFHTIQAGSSEHNCLDNGTTWTFAGESIAGPRASQLQGKIIAFGAIRTGSSSSGPTTVAANLGGEIITQYNAAGAFWSTSWAYDRYTLGNDGAFNDAAPAVHYYMFAHYSSNLFPEGEADLVRWVKDPFSWVEPA